MMPPPPPAPVDQRPAGTVLLAGLGHSTVLADFDFETYSEAGFVWSDPDNKWVRLEGVPTSKRKGLTSVGAAVYAQHPTTEVLSLRYNLKDGTGRHGWKPGEPMPLRLFQYLSTGAPIEAHNSSFEHWIWNHVCVPRYGFPPLPIQQLRCSMAKARAHALPGALEKIGEVLGLDVQKDKDGTRLLNKFSIPRDPTKANPARRIRPEDDPVDAQRLYDYNDTDIVAESHVSARIPDLSPEELEFWIIDQRINYRGVQVDVPSVENCISVLRQAQSKYNAELNDLTYGMVPEASKLKALAEWLRTQGCPVGTGKGSTDEEAFDKLLELPTLTRAARRAIEIRQLVGSASVKKVYSLRNMSTVAGRLHDLFVYHSARTGRAAGRDAQPQNMPKAGPMVYLCSCGQWHGAHTHVCPWCGTLRGPGKAKKWNPAAVEHALQVIAHRSLDMLEFFFGEALLTISGCLRGMFVAAPGHDLVCSDFSAIEGVVGAELTGCEWRREVFRTHGKIYEMSVAKITGEPFEAIMAHAGYDVSKPEWWLDKQTGEHHPLRQGIGKVAELASGFGGWIGSWKAFGADQYFDTDNDIKRSIVAWRDASPEFPEMWGGQSRGKPWDDNKKREMFGLEGMFISAMLDAGTWYTYRDISYIKHGDAVYCRLPSGRLLTYHRPRLNAGGGFNGDEWAITYEGWNSNPLMGRIGWVRLDTYGGRLFENVVQAVARDILAHAIVELERAGYAVVLHIHDEIVVEVPEGWGSVEEVERIMGTMPQWATHYPIRAAGGYRAKRYRKD